MKYNIDYKPKNKIVNPCEFLTEEKVIQFRENSRNKKMSLMQREHKCLKKNKIITVNNDCVDCDFYKNYIEVIEQQAKKIAKLEEYINEFAKIENENYEREEVYGCDGNIQRSVSNE